MRTHVNITLRVNGDSRSVPDNTTVADLVREVVGSEHARGVAVARNDLIVPRSTWSEVVVEASDAIEIAAPFQGG